MGRVGYYPTVVRDGFIVAMFHVSPVAWERTL